MSAGEFKKKDKLAKPKPSHKGTVIYRLKPFRNQVRTAVAPNLALQQRGKAEAHRAHPNTAEGIAVCAVL